MGRPLTCAALAVLLAGCSADLDLGSNDAAIPYDAECRPGTYSGTYDCTTTAGSSFPLSGISGNGTIAITLVPAGAHSLALAPDASLSTTSSGTTSTSSLSGVLDCSTRKLVGTDGHVTFSSASFMGEINGTGSFEATYDADASPPALVGGTLVAPASLAAMCTWSATLE
jgi:hypothetical protein